MSLDFNERELLQIIRALNINRAYGHDNISIRMIKICDKSLLKPLTVLLRNSIKSSCNRDIWKTSNIIPVHKEMTNNWLKTTQQFLFYLSLVKYSKKLFSIEFITFCWKKIYKILTVNTEFSPVNTEYCRRGSVVCFYVLFSFLSTIIIIEKKKIKTNKNLRLPQR